MRYLYADSTPFPLPQNFLATICAGTDACVSILKAEELLDECNSAVREAEAKAARDLAQLSALSHRVDAALGAGSVPPPPADREGDAPARGSVADSTLGKVRELAWSTLDQARQDVARARDAKIAAAAQAQPRAAILPALSQFLSAHEVPDTAWGIRWTAGLGGAATRAELHARTPFGLEATFDVSIPAAHVWARAPRVSVIGFTGTISMKKKPLVGKVRPALVALGEYCVTHVVLTADRATLRLSKSARAPSEGIEFVFTGESGGDVLATRVDKAGYPKDDGERLGLADSNLVTRLWTRVTTLLGGLVAYRTRAHVAKLGGVPVGEVGRPLVVAQALLRALAPYVREIASRTQTPRELALKRELGDGCREELFIHYDTVLERVRGLTPPHQAQFDVFGLREEPASVRPGAGAQVWKLPVVRPPALRAS